MSVAQSQKNLVPKPNYHRFSKAKVGNKTSECETSPHTIASQAKSGSSTCLSEFGCIYGRYIFSSIATCAVFIAAAYLLVGLAGNYYLIHIPHNHDSVITGQAVLLCWIVLLLYFKHRYLRQQQSCMLLDLLACESGATITPASAATYIHHINSVAGNKSRGLLVDRLLGALSQFSLTRKISAVQCYLGLQARKDVNSWISSFTPIYAALSIIVVLSGTAIVTDLYLHWFNGLTSIEKSTPAMFELSILPAQLIYRLTDLALFPAASILVVIPLRRMQQDERAILQHAYEYCENHLIAVLSEHTPEELKNQGQVCYSQEGEDLVLARLLNRPDNTTGFYVDIGAHHPCRFSNTHYFYLKGWRGINVEPLPGSIDVFRQHRPEDINLETAVFNRKTELTYYTFAEPALNTLSQELAEMYQVSGSKVTGKVVISTITLAELLDTYLPSEVTCIDFLTIDVEGVDLEVLQSNNWQRYRPRLILVEILNLRSLDDMAASPVAQFLKQVGYAPVSKTLNTVIFAERTVC